MFYFLRRTSGNTITEVSFYVNGDKVSINTDYLDTETEHVDYVESTMHKNRAEAREYYRRLLDQGYVVKTFEEPAMYSVLERTVDDEVTEMVYFTVMLDDVRVQTYTPYYEVIWDCETMYMPVDAARRHYKALLLEGYVAK